MTTPRQVLPGASYLVTRRCSQRQFLLKPSPVVAAVFRWVLALAARRHGILIHAWCVLSDHYHLVVTDPLARLPAFAQLLDGLVARALNFTYGRREALWAPSSFSAVALGSPDDVVEKAAYTLANPVKAGLVRRACEWPGLWSGPDRIGGPAEDVAHPGVYFRRLGPESLSLQLSVPPGFASAEEFRDRVVARLDEVEREAVRSVESAGRGFLGADRVLRQRHTAQATGPEPRRRTLRPRWSSKDPARLRELLGHFMEFVRSYRAAWNAYREGVADVVFPPGTYQLRVSLNVACAAPG